MAVGGFLADNVIGDIVAVNNDFFFSEQRMHRLSDQFGKMYDRAKSDVEFAVLAKVGKLLLPKVKALLPKVKDNMTSEVLVTILYIFLMN